MWSNEKTWVLYVSPIPQQGSRIASYKDKQLEIAHAVWYCKSKRHLWQRYKWKYCIQYTLSERSGCASSETEFCENSNVEDNVRNVLFQ